MLTNGDGDAYHDLRKIIGTPGMIRTCDPLIRSQVLYPAELRVHRGRTDRLQSNWRCVKMWDANADKDVVVRLAGEISLTCPRNEFGIFYIDSDRTPFAVTFIVCRLVFDRIEGS